MFYIFALDLHLHIPVHACGTYVFQFSMGMILLTFILKRCALIKTLLTFTTASKGSNDHYGRKFENCKEEMFSNIDSKYSAYSTSSLHLK